jgi:hypothetical protein
VQEEEKVRERRRSAAIAVAVSALLGVALLGGTATAKTRVFQRNGPIAVPNATAPPDTNGDGYPDFTGNGGQSDGVLASHINIRGSLKAKDINVSIRLIDPAAFELVFILVAPNGPSITLEPGVGNPPQGAAAAPDAPFGASLGTFGTGPNTCAGTPTTFDDQASLFINDTNSTPAEPAFPDEPDGGGVEAFQPYAGSYKPAGLPIATLGTKLKGRWLLLVDDYSNGSGAGPGIGPYVQSNATLGCWKLTATGVSKTGKSKKK